ncbi:CopG family transcriptional regulator [Sulfurovum sp. bin170]|uniref:ribbon-helix-helix domain-containing protein n=1 Tax=Sulfurovum sp. bin170 TaxID=2695268 RepID=UPI0013DFBDA0|nr:ribbon-helix-helix domain-containing protein [Sulfurovum sp. bin170]NEW59910.1 CopG family transcriptional regulator [Sulfurovum sp. bin170]
MTRAKIAITIDQMLLETLDDLVKNSLFQNRSQAINNAVKDMLSRIQKTRLELECQKLIMEEERDFADLGIEEDFIEWETY